MNRKKRIVLAFMTVFVLIAIVGVIVLSLTEKPEDVFVSSFVYSSDYKPGSFIFYEPEYGINVFDDPDYSDVVPYLYYERDGVRVCITDENYARYGATIEFFGRYFDALKAGDTEEFNSLHSQRYFENNRQCTSIAPQRLYDIILVYKFEKDMTDPDYGNVTKYVYEANYKIMKNDGTFRSDIGSDASRKLYLEVVEKGNDIFVDACGDNYNMPE